MVYEVWMSTSFFSMVLLQESTSLSTSASSEVETTQDGATAQRSRRRGVRVRDIDPEDMIRLQELKDRRTAEIQV